MQHTQYPLCWDLHLQLSVMFLMKIINKIVLSFVLFQINALFDSCDNCFCQLSFILLSHDFIRYRQIKCIIGLMFRLLGKLEEVCITDIFLNLNFLVLYDLRKYCTALPR